MAFKDHFSANSNNYARFRPTYPLDLFEFIVSQVSAYDQAWDCATGNGQAATIIAKYFKKVIATDASKEQIAHTSSQNNIKYQVALAEQTNIKSHSVDLITVAQALHWFDFDRFYKEVKRVSKKDAILAVWGYTLFKTNVPAIDDLILNFYEDITGKYWPPERRHIDNRYQSIPFPFEEVPTPKFNIKNTINSTHLVNYLGTWSAVKNYREATGKDPLIDLKSEMNQIVKDDESISIVTPLFLRIGKVNS